MDDGLANSSQTTPHSGPSQNNPMLLTPDEQAVIGAIERGGASLSLMGVFLIFIAYAAFKRLRTVPNTFILCASIANVGASIACLMGYSGIAAGDNSALCQAQAFMLEMFMQSDPWWSFAMAVNVYLVFFHAASPTSFRRHLWVYCLICYGLPAVPAIVLLICQKYSADPIYGNATLWCWIDDPQSSLRIWSYYLPIWVCIVLSAVIYVAVGYHVFHQRNQLRNLTLSNQAKEMSTSDVRDSADKTASGQPSHYGTVTTEVQITAMTSDSLTPPPTPAPSIGASVHHLSHHPWEDSSPSDEDPVISPAQIFSSAATVLSPTSTAPSPFPFTTISSISCQPRAKATTKCSTSRRSRFAPLARFVSRLRRLDPVKLAYLRTSFVFALSVLVTWTPSSINRVYALADPSHPNYGLNVASAVVLPLQGVWNAVIFFTTSWAAVHEVVGARSMGRRWGQRRYCRWCGGSASERGATFGHRAGWREASDGRCGDIEMSPRAARVGTVRVARGSSF